MKIIEYDKFLIREDGIILNSKTNEIVKLYNNASGELLIASENGVEMIKYLIARLFFDFDVNFQRLIKVGYLDFDKSNIKVENLKVYSSKDKFNKSGKYIILFADEFLFFNRKGFVSKHTSLREAYKNFI